MAQKPADINLKELMKLALLNPTVEEVGAYFGVSKVTAIKYLKKPEYKQVLEDGRNNRKTSLKRYQWQAAAKGNVAMLIWLGKNELDQKEPLRQIDADVRMEVTEHKAPPRAQTMAELAEMIQAEEIRARLAEHVEEGES